MNIPLTFVWGRWLAEKITGVVASRPQLQQIVPREDDIRMMYRNGGDARARASLASLVSLPSGIEAVADARHSQQEAWPRGIPFQFAAQARQVDA